MAKETKVTVKASMEEFLQTQYKDRRWEVRQKEKRNFAQNEWADEIGILPQTLSRYMNGDRGMTMDSAVMLLRFFGEDVLPHFEYNEVFDKDTAVILAKWPKLTEDQRKFVLNFFQDPQDEAPGLDINALPA